MSPEDFREEHIEVGDLVMLRDGVEVNADATHGYLGDVMPEPGTVYTVRDVIAHQFPQQASGFTFSFSIRLEEIVNPPHCFTEAFQETYHPGVCFRKVRKPDISLLREIAADVDAGVKIS